MSKFKTNAPFGIQVKRFATIGFHPGLDKTGSLRKQGGIGPGQYNVKYPDCWHTTRCSQETWTRKLEMEEFSATLGYRNARILQERNEAKKANGPGTLDVSSSLFKQQSNNVKHNVGFGKEKRFLKLVSTNIPPPGTYGDPYIKYDKGRKPQLQFTPKQIFEWDGFINRFKIGRTDNKHSLPCNIYKVPLGGIDATLAKKVSKRGPYDCFTGPRNDSTIKGYFAPVKRSGENVIEIKVTPGLDKLLKDPRKRNYGKFLKSERNTILCPRDPDEPGPGHFNIAKWRVFVQNKYAFNQSVRNVRPTKTWDILPGVGRYNDKPVSCKYKDQRPSWVFKSKGKRGFYQVVTYNNF